MKERALNMELLRIIAMGMVLVVHTIGALGQPTLIDFQTFSLEPLGKLCILVPCIICVNVFILLSGWFEIQFSVKKLLGIWFQAIFWSSISAIIDLAISNRFTIKQVIGIFGMDGRLWFLISYTFLFIISPILNTFAKTARRKEFLSVIIFFYIYQTILGWGFKIGGFGLGLSSLPFIGLYLLAQYVKKHPNKVFTLTPKYDLLIYIISSLIIVSTIIFFTTKGEYIERMYAYICPLVIISSLYFFLFFTKLKIIKFRKPILYLSSSAFAVYLFHDNEFIVDYFQQTVRSIYNNWGLFALSISLVALFLIITTIDKIRFLLWKGILSITTKKRAV